MNRLTFHNRDRIFTEYTATKGHNRCIYCDFQYHPDYTKQDNTFMWAGCDHHLAHRECIINQFGRDVQIKNISCNLCLQIARFDQSNVRVMRHQYQRQSRNMYDYIQKQVEKTGVYKLK